MLSARGALEERSKLQLEGLLQARSEDMRHGRGSRRRVEVQTVAFERPLSASARSYDMSSVRRCEDCGEEIGSRRLRAMPRAMLCLHCQRDAEQATTAS
jgi:RNA polymerase-binding transcription factor DksA